MYTFSMSRAAGRIAEPHDRSQRLQALRAKLSAKALVEPASSQRIASAWRRITGEIGPRRLLDLLTAKAGSGGGLVALSLCVEACRGRGELVVIDPRRAFYPPAAVAWGVEASRLLVVAPPTQEDAIAATEIALRSPAVGAVWASLGAVDGRQFRRLLLAVEAGKAFGALVRPACRLAEPSWGDVQLRIATLMRDNLGEHSLLVRATQTRNRHGPVGGEATLSIDWRAGTVQELPTHRDAATPTKNARHLASRLACATGSA